VKNQKRNSRELWGIKRLNTMSSDPAIHTAADGQAVITARSLRQLYFIRAGFSVTWVILVALLAKASTGVAVALLIIYPAWDVIGTFLDVRANQGATSRTPQYVNAVISMITTVAVAFALQKGIPETLVVFGTWAIGTGLIQLILGLRRRKLLGGQWPMIISGAQSMIGGTSFILLAHDPTKGITSLAGYAAFGAFYYLLAAFRLAKMANKA